jgi:hypothetical protein
MIVILTMKASFGGLSGGSGQKATVAWAVSFLLHKGILWNFFRATLPFLWHLVWQQDLLYH